MQHGSQLPHVAGGQKDDRALRIAETRRVDYERTVKRDDDTQAMVVTPTR